ncbi:MAG: hypothetical protein HY842_11745 [Bacteroidetes bacterium]|nr:hypothetical protein [Bacteroidota bacterium]
MEKIRAGRHREDAAAGIVNVRDVVDLGKKTGTRHFIIEQESYQDKTPLACAKDDLQIMKSWGY